MSPMRMLESGIPLSLLLDLVMGPESADLLDHERSDADSRLVRRPQPVRQRPHRTLRSV